VRNVPVECNERSPAVAASESTIIKILPFFLNAYVESLMNRIAPGASVELVAVLNCIGMRIMQNTSDFLSQFWAYHEIENRFEREIHHADSELVYFLAAAALTHHGNSLPHRINSSSSYHPSCYFGSPQNDDSCGMLIPTRHETAEIDACRDFHPSFVAPIPLDTDGSRVHFRGYELSYKLSRYIVDGEPYIRSIQQDKLNGSYMIKGIGVDGEGCDPSVCPS
jgi:hypothetical protein